VTGEVDAGGYEEGDVNTVAYEPGDVNTVSGPAPADDDDGPEDYEDGDANELEGGTAEVVLRYVASALSDDPESVVIESEPRRGGGVRFRLHVAPDDMGRVIGRRGRTAQAIRTVVAVAGSRDGQETYVDIADD
jgi:predicted RNA-binding protein YlqC (UPF0109 family)